MDIKYTVQNRPLGFEEKLPIKKLGRPIPDLQIKAMVVSKSREFNRYFKRENSYDRFLWLCGCPQTNKFFLF